MKTRLLSLFVSVVMLSGCASYQAQTLTNLSPHTAPFAEEKEGVTVSCKAFNANPEFVAEKVHTSTVGRATAYGIGALIIWPLAIPAVVDGIKSSNANEALDRDYSSKTATQQTLMPYGRVNGLIFVPVESYNESFTLTLVDKESNEDLQFLLKAPRN